MEQDLKKYDKETLRCRLLGGPVPFQYCRSMNEKLPCRLILGCWSERLPIIEFLKDNFTEDELAKAFAIDDRSRLVKLVELVEKAKRPEES